MEKPAQGWSDQGKEPGRWPDKAPTFSGKEAQMVAAATTAEMNKEAPRLEKKEPAPASNKRGAPACLSNATADTKWHKLSEGSCTEQGEEAGKKVVPLSEHGKEARRWPDKALTCPGKGACQRKDAEMAVAMSTGMNEAAPPLEDKKAAPASNKRRGPALLSDATHDTKWQNPPVACSEQGEEAEKKAPLPEDGKEEPGPSTQGQEARTGNSPCDVGGGHTGEPERCHGGRGPNAAMAAAALSPYDPDTGKHKKYKVWQTELRQGIASYFPPGATFRQIAGVIQTTRGTQVDLVNVSGEEALRQVLPAGSVRSRGDTAVYHAAYEFLNAQPQ